MNPIGYAPLAAIRYERGADIDGLLAGVCVDLSGMGLRLGGLLQVTAGEPGSRAAAVHVIDLRTGQAFDIWQDCGPCAKGCRLDENALATAEPALQAAIDAGVDLLLINRFGRAECYGRGLRPVFESALASRVPVLTAVREPYDRGWAEFHGGLAVELPAEADRIVRWATGSQTCIPSHGAVRSRCLSDARMLQVERVHLRGT